MSAQNLEQYHWKNRVIVFFEDHETPKKDHQQKEIFKQNQEGFKDREVIVLLPLRKQAFSLKHQLGIADRFAGLILIGKDGHIKLKREGLVEADEIFKLIDGMPMRKEEMKRKKGKH